jgi:hypothetical protein
MRATLLLALAACHHGPDVTPDALGTCAATITHETPLLSASHVPQGTVVSWPSNPPTSGPHYPTHADWATAYPIAIERGNYLHNEEHGGVVMLYNCPQGCPDIVEKLTTYGQQLAQDPQCTPPINARWIVSPDSMLEDGVVVAAAAWGWTYKTTCFNADTLDQFFADHYATGGPDRTNCTTTQDGGM